MQLDKFERLEERIIQAMDLINHLKQENEEDEKGIVDAIAARDPFRRGPITGNISLDQIVRRQGVE